ncbi:recombinase family protein [Castellaniella hirudinis]|uniref:recombinase family protein n=1 Tax=Castellaniella hirudinis TaxID=1144617 RepID=UPI0039C088CA
MNTSTMVIKKRCAVYTRKSTDEGLGQEYNSLEAQRDAGLAYITSQRHEGWVALDDTFDDGGYSGGNMERPGLQRLMRQVEAGQIDIIVVYKIDRLTRSLSDFARLVDVFDRTGVSFVSVTQQFNTTTSMGRLTLNILLSFAQFEREVTGERIRDKIAASKAKGMWMGGMPPLGYDVVDRKLVVNEREADLVRDIFRRYAEHGSAARLVRELAIEGHTTKVWTTQAGKHRPGRYIDQQYIFKLIRNRLFLGEITHKGKAYPGQHQAVVPQPLWDAAHAVIDSRKTGPREHYSTHPALLAGILFAADGQRMLPTFTRKKNGRMYRYYVPYQHKKRHAGATANPAASDLGPLPAADLEIAVLEQVHLALQTPEMLVAVWQSAQRQTAQPIDEAQVVLAMKNIGYVWDQLFPAEQQRIVRLLIDRVQLHDQGLDIHWSEDAGAGFANGVTDHPLIDEMAQEAAA